MKIRANDEVVVVAGKDKGKHGRVLQVLKDKRQVVVEGVNVQVRHLRRNPQNPQAGGRVSRPAPIDVSNVMAWSGEDSRGVRVRYQGAGAEKVRVAAKSGARLATTGKRSRKPKKERSSPAED